MAEARVMSDLPKLGLGMYRMPKDDVHHLVDLALKYGYRSFDTATGYRNEQALGDALKILLPLHNLCRDDIFITSKLAPADQGYEEAIEAVKESVDRIGMGPIDLYLVHWPGKAGLPPTSTEHKEWRRNTWKAFEHCLDIGLLRNIGVSNYRPIHIEEMKEYAKVLPYVNQVEIHPYYPNLPTVEACMKDHIRVQAYSSLAQGKLISNEFLGKHPELKQILQARNIAAAQLMLAWALHKGYHVIPKASSEIRLIENIKGLTVGLSSSELELIDLLADDPDAGKVCWDPAVVV